MRRFLPLVVCNCNIFDQYAQRERNKELNLPKAGQIKGVDLYMSFVEAAY